MLVKSNLIWFIFFAPFDTSADRSSFINS